MQEALKERNIILRRIIHGTDTQSADAYILHFNNHCITMRKFGDHWIDFDWELDQQKVILKISFDDYVKHMQETASVFVLEGDLPYPDTLEDFELPDPYIDEAMSERRKGQNKQSQQQRRARLYEEAKERKQADDAIRHSIARKEEDVQMAERKRKAIERSNESSDQRASRLNKMRETAARNRQ